ncbi:class I SAM-dependent methyltransferase [Aeromonas dhakensis]|uniref:class I SAM-dependent methyltransferase n=1 Tax=Aeromonas dhakensis TaxID=196024 RepID=UPI0028D93CEF|nr:methyltransferase domain-containing protein [Aeromonas dhakensis]
MSSNSKQFLRECIYDDSLLNFGLQNKEYLDDVIDAWSDFENDLNGRWHELEHFGDAGGTILDMAAGVGSFVFRGLNRGHDVYGVEPEAWKLKYIKMRIDEEKKYSGYADRIKHGLGEKLHFQNETFDLVTTYQTLEHVQDVNSCIDELIRVTKKGGKIIIQAPDYFGFFEPHYLLPLLPKLSVCWAKVILKILRKPTSGIDTINFVTSKKLVRHIKNAYPHLSIINVGESRKTKSLKLLSDKFHIPIALMGLFSRVHQFIKSFYHCECMYIVIRK